MSCPLASDPGWGHGQSQEECERQSEECGSVLRPRTFLVVSLGAQGDGAPWPVLVTLCVAGKLQPPAVTPGEDATLFRVEAGEDGKAQADRDMVRIRRVYQLLAEDIILDVEVVPDEEQQQGSSLELEEKTVEEQCQERPGGPSELPALDVLQALVTLQVELSSEPEKTCRAYVWFMCKSQERRKRDLAQGSTIIQGIPGFWAKVVSFLLLLGGPLLRMRGRYRGRGMRRGGGKGTEWVLVDPEESVVLGNWQAPKAQLSRVQARPHQ